MTGRTMFVGLGTLGAVGLLMVNHGDGAYAAPPSRPSAVAGCQTAQLAIAPDYGEGAAGHASLVFLVHNRAGQTCTLYGYPGAQLLDGAYRGLPTYLRWGGDNTPPRRLVYLTPGADAYFALTWVRIPTAGRTCPTASFIRITPQTDHPAERVRVYHCVGRRGRPHRVWRRPHRLTRRARAI